MRCNLGWVCRKDIDLREMFTPPLDTRLSAFQPMFDASPGLEYSMQRVTTIAQALLLRPKEVPKTTPLLLLINTHLFFHGDAPHIRNIHVAAMMAEAHSWAREHVLEASDGCVPIATVFCGDLNSDLNDGVPGVVEMLQSGKLAADYWDWAYGADFDFRETRDNGAREKQIQDAKEAALRGETPRGSDAASSAEVCVCQLRCTRVCSAGAAAHSVGTVKLQHAGQMSGTEQ